MKQFFKKAISFIISAITIFSLTVVSANGLSTFPVSAKTGFHPTDKNSGAIVLNGHDAKTFANIDIIRAEAAKQVEKKYSESCSLRNRIKLIPDIPIGAALSGPCFATKGKTGVMYKITLNSNSALFRGEENNEIYINDGNYNCPYDSTFLRDESVCGKTDGRKIKTFDNSS